jgi:4-hydroxybenzoate polyprenyltransferase
LLRYLVRPRAWWFNKVPLSVTLVLLLIDGRRLRVLEAAALALVVLAVCAVGNYGYALNDLYDVDEDRRVGRANATIGLGKGRMWLAIVASALLAVLFGAAAGGSRGAGLAVAVLLLPLAYSVPPLRIKERKWLGVFADALAAHVFPAMLALAAVSHLLERPVSAALAGCVLAWSAAAGIRGILSHQLHTADRDRSAGLATVVHDLGRVRLERVLVFGLLPLEVLGFLGAIVLCDTGPVLCLLGGLFLAYEAVRTFSGDFKVTAMRPEGQRYVPFVDEGFYKAWGPLMLALDAARVDPLYLLLLVPNVWWFRPHLRNERARLRATWAALAGRLSRS